jgi:ubiquinone/menaquinone biosynthesis C-methylase UbiE
LDPKPGEHILDIGCGDGYYDNIIAKSGAKVVGIDVHLRQLSRAQHLYSSEHTDFFYMDAEAMSFTEASFDKAVSFCVVEHLYHDEQVIQNISRVLKSGGCFVFSVDSLSNTEITAVERARHSQHYAVNTYYTMCSLREKLSRTGFDIKEWQYILTTSHELAMSRLSWKLDKLPKVLVGVKSLGYLVLWVAWMLSSFSHRRQLDHSKRECGLTLLVCARKHI